MLRKLHSLPIALEQSSATEGLEMAVKELGKARIDTRGVLVVTDRQDESRYANADETFVFWNKGDTAFVTEGKDETQTYADCVAAK